MKLIGLKEAKTNLSAFVDAAQRDRILITRRGKPAALMIGVEGQDLEQVLLASDARFWRIIRQRRQRDATLTSDDIRRSFGLETSSVDEPGLPARRNEKRKRASSRKKP